MNQSEEIKSAEAFAESKYPKKRGNYWKSYNVIQQEKQDAFISGFKYDNQFKSEWVSVEDGSPEVNQLITYYEFEFPEDIKIGKYDGEMCFTHWMPLPTPPKVKQ